MKIRKAETGEVSKIFDFVKNAVTVMLNNGIYQWDEIYPAMDDFLNDSQKNQLYIVEIKESPAACFTLNNECDEDYKNGEWKYNGPDYCVVHRLCVNPEFQNKGLGSKICEQIEEMLKEQNIKAIKLDCFSGNPYSLKMYRKAGYSNVGFADWRKGRFVLMEKLIK